MDLTLFKSAVTLFVISSILLPVFKWLNRYVKFLLHYRDVPHLSLLPVLGNTHHVIGKRLYEFFHDMSNKFKNESYYMFWNGTLPCICFHKADHVSTIISSSKMIEKSPGYKVLSGLLGDGILMSKGHKWLSRRKLLTPTFHFEILNGFQQIMNEQSEILVDILLEKCKTEKVINVEPLITNCTVDILCETAMGQNVNAQRDPNSPYLKSVQRVACLMEKRVFKVYLRNNLIFNLLHGKEYNKHLKISQDFTTNVIMKRNEEFENGEIDTHGRQALLDLLLKSRKEDPSLTFQDIREEVDNFLFAGHDTTSATLCWVLQLLGSHPEVLKKVHEELDEILQGSNRYFTNEDLSKMKYMHCVIKETMRIMTPVIHVGRTVTEDTKLGDKTILKGSAVLILLSDIHRDERHFPEPEAFKPERFLKIKETVDNVDNAYIYMPFSAGPRNCIGQRFAQNELKIVLGSILRRFHVEATQTLAETKPIFNIVLRPEHGLHVKFTERS